MANVIEQAARAIRDTLTELVGEREKAHLEKADLRWADLRKAYHNARTWWPAGFNAKDHGAILVGP